MNIKHLKYYITYETNPYKNLALEEYLLHNVSKDECILYLWQNEKTVVIGRNQNPWKECRIKELGEAGGRLVRRLSGGGAVYHDMGNLNFTFLMTKENYNVEKQLEVIIKAVNNLGIPAMKSGRNDITVEGRKFSGNAFYSVGDKCYHHGTILVDVDMPSLSKYLNVSKTKLISKGVDSVKSRVTNLNEYRPDLNIDRLRDELLIAFGKTYELDPIQIDDAQLPHDELMLGAEKFSSWEWNYGRKIEFSDSFERRFSWGDIDLQMVVEGGIVKDCRAYSDSLDTELFEELPKYLIGCTFTWEAIEEALTGIKVENDKRQIIDDIILLIREKI
ncbi:MAG: lipoate--protein ligase [Anaerolineaceae bacterium]|nr:MAG: lipoate--protein ligase [Anaerolineaceae bacterium]